MNNLKDLINLAQADGGKFFVMDESGEVKLVILSMDGYKHLLENQNANFKIEQTSEAENINEQIIQAQLEEQENKTPFISAKIQGPKIINQNPPIALNQTSIPEHPARVDLRQEVIDPSFDFEGPKVEIDDL